MISNVHVAFKNVENFLDRKHRVMISESESALHSADINTGYYADNEIDI